MKTFSKAFSLAVLVFPLFAQATPWIPVGDMRAKHSVQQLADKGCFAAPVTTWPLMWADISPELDNPDAPRPLPQYLGLALP